MKPNAKPSRKQLQLTKDQSQLLMVVAIASIVTVFCLVSAKALLGQAIYQSKVISARNKSAAQLRESVNNANTMVNQYKAVFLGGSSENIIGGKYDPSHPDPYAIPPDGDNGRIVIDALPTVYDFPALLTSMSKLLSSDSVGSQSIGGSDQSAQANDEPSSNPQPVGIDITVSGTTSLANAQKLVKDFERSIRPFDITHLTLSGTEASTSLGLNLTTYYQNAKTISITSKEIK